MPNYLETRLYTCMFCIAPKLKLILLKPINTWATARDYPKPNYTLA
jgi:hypothetical protein